MKPNLTKRRVVSGALLGLLLCAAHTLPRVAACAAGGAPPTLSMIAAQSAPTAAEEAAVVAQETLRRLPPEARLGEIKNERLRRAVQLTYRAVVELADNREPGKVAALNAKFERAYAAVERETARGEYQTCAGNCKVGDGEPCRTKCKTFRNKFCGCKLIVFGCLVAECLF